MKGTKRQHTIPDNAMLALFADENGHIHVRQSNGTVISTRPTNISTRNFFYTIRQNEGASNAVEIYLASLENEYRQIFDAKLSQGKHLSLEERLIVSAFIVAMMHRTEPSRRAERHFLDEILEYSDELRRKHQQGEKIASGIRDDNATHFSEEEIRRWSDELGSLHSERIPQMVSELTPIVASMGWAIWKAPAGKSFITSDQPAVMFAPERVKKHGLGSFGGGAGLGHVDVELSLPLSSKLAFHASWNIAPLTYLDGGEDVVSTINERTAIYAHDFLVGESDDAVNFSATSEPS